MSSQRSVIDGASYFRSLDDSFRSLEGPGARRAKQQMTKAINEFDAKARWNMHSLRAVAEHARTDSAYLDTLGTQIKQSCPEFAGGISEEDASIFLGGLLRKHKISTSSAYFEQLSQNVDEVSGQSEFPVDTSIPAAAWADTYGSRQSASTATGDPSEGYQAWQNTSYHQTSDGTLQQDKRYSDGARIQPSSSGGSSSSRTAGAHSGQGTPQQDEATKAKFMLN